MNWNALTAICFVTLIVSNILVLVEYREWRHLFFTGAITIVVLCAAAVLTP